MTILTITAEGQVTLCRELLARQRPAGNIADAFGLCGPGRPALDIDGINEIAAEAPLQVQGITARVLH